MTQSLLESCYITLYIGVSAEQVELKFMFAK